MPEPLEADVEDGPTRPLIEPSASGSRSRSSTDEKALMEEEAEEREPGQLEALLGWTGREGEGEMDSTRPSMSDGIDKPLMEKVSAAPPSPSLFGVPLRYISLALLVLQNTGLVLQMRYSLSGVDESKRYISSTAVVLMEACKLCVCLCVLAWESASLPEVARQLYAGLVTHWWDFAKLAIPASIYTLQNNVLFYALARLDVTTFQITYQLKIVTTAVCMRILLAKQLSLRQWVALCLLMLGVIGIQVDSLSAKPTTVSTSESAPLRHEVAVKAPPPIGADGDRAHPHAGEHEHEHVAKDSQHARTKRDRCRFDILLDSLATDHVPTLDCFLSLPHSDDSHTPIPRPAIAATAETDRHRPLRSRRSLHPRNGDRSRDRRSRSVPGQSQRDVPASSNHNGATAATAPSASTPPPKVDNHTLEHLKGLMAVLIACLSSGFAGAYFEAILKESQTSLWMRNIQLSIFGLLFSLIAAYANDYRRITEMGFLYGYRLSTYLIVVNQAGGGLLVALVIKYADNLLKSFSTCKRLPWPSDSVLARGLIADSPLSQLSPSSSPAYAPSGYSTSNRRSVSHAARAWCYMLRTCTGRAKGRRNCIVLNLGMSWVATWNWKPACQYLSVLHMSISSGRSNCAATPALLMQWTAYSETKSTSRVMRL